MIPNSCIKLESKKFPVMDGEDDEIVNPNMYGKALCQYLELNVPANTGMKIPFYCAEDWGWWVEIHNNGFEMGLCIYSDPDAASDPNSYAILPSIHEAKKWSWRKFGKIDQSHEVTEIMDKIESLLVADTEIDQVKRYDDFPY